ncbi:MAG: CHASE2 domain-containing protein [Parvibaculaceae bacterium]
MAPRQGMKPWSLASWPRSAWAVLTTILVALLTLLGGGKSLTAAYKSFTETDRIIEISAALSGAAEGSFPVTLIKVDDETMARWGAPSITPHAALARLIEIADKGAAAAVIVDIDLASENPAAAPDPALVAALSTPQANVLPVMFVRSFRAGAANDREIGGAALVNTTPYDGVFATTAKAMWVSVLTPLSADRIVRRLRLWQTVCAGAEGMSYPSPALVIAARFAGEGDRLGDLGTFLASQVDRRCKRLDAAPDGWPHRVTPDVAIQYMFNAGSEETTVKTVVRGGVPVALFKQVPAWTLVNFGAGGATEAGEIHPQAFADRIVVIGVTHANSRDIYATPLGSQPGAVILANTVAAASAMSGMPEASPTMEIVIILGIFAVLAFISYRLQMAPAIMVAGPLIVATALILSRFFGFDVAIRIIAVTVTLFVLHKFVDSLVGVVYDWSHGKGWRAMLKPH